MVNILVLTTLPPNKKNPQDLGNFKLIKADCLIFSLTKQNIEIPDIKLTFGKIGNFINQSTKCTDESWFYSKVKKNTLKTDKMTLG